MNETRFVPLIANFHLHDFSNMYLRSPNIGKKKEEDKSTNVSK